MEMLLTVVVNRTKPWHEEGKLALRERLITVPKVKVSPAYASALQVLGHSDRSILFDR